MRLIEEWARLRKWLREYAPQTSDFLLDGAVEDDITRFARIMGVRFPDELTQWWLCCNGTRRDDLAEVIPPFYTPYGLAAAQRSWLDNAQSGQRDQCGELVPFAYDGCGGELVVDLRPGPQCGAVLEWDAEYGGLSAPVWSGLVDMLVAINDALYAGQPVVHCVPKLTLWGRLDWRTR